MKYYLNVKQGRELDVMTQMIIPNETCSVVDKMWVDGKDYLFIMESSIFTKLRLKRVHKRIRRIIRKNEHLDIMPEFGPELNEACE